MMDFAGPKHFRNMKFLKQRYCKSNDVSSGPQFSYLRPPILSVPDPAQEL